MADEIQLEVPAIPSYLTPDPNDASRWDAEVASGMAMDAEVMEYMPSDVTSSMMLVPYNQPMYGPHLPGLEPGNVHNNSPVPASFVASDVKENKSTDLRDSKAVRGMCGLRNMGNTCFMNSGLQCLMHNAQLVQYLLDSDPLPLETLTGRFKSLADRAWSGEFSLLHPSQFKETLGFMHGQFRDYRQHDGQEFLALLLDTLHEELNQAKSKKKSHSPFEDISENSSDSQYMSEASTSKLSELEALEIDSGKEENVHGGQNNQRSRVGSGSDKGTSSGSEEGTATGDDLKVASIEEFFKKDMKTLNTNMMQGEEPTSSVTTGSEKFPKAENSKKTSSLHQSKSPSRQQQPRSPLRNRVENDCEKANSSPLKNKKTNLLVAKKNLKGNMKNGCSNSSSTSSNSSNNDEEEDPIKRMKMDCSKSEILESLSKDGLATSFHNYHAAYAVPDMLQKEGFFPIGEATKVTNKLVELEGIGPALTSEDTCLNELKSKLRDSPIKHPNLLYPTAEDTTRRLSGEEKPSSAPHTSTSEGQDSSFVPNNKQFLLAQRSPLQRNKEGVPEGSERGYGQEGEKEWEDYTTANRSPIVDFQGQFKNTVVCAVCRHVSVIYEPFMYLSVPLPRAMEKQLVVTFIPKRWQTPGRYLVTLNKLDTVKELKKALISIVYGDGLPKDKELFLAEGLDYRISRFLGDHIHLRYINDSFRLLYAFEAYSKSVMEEPVHAAFTPNGVGSLEKARAEPSSGTPFEKCQPHAADLCETARLADDNDDGGLRPAGESAFESPVSKQDGGLDAEQDGATNDRKSNLDGSRDKVSSSSSSSSPPLVTSTTPTTQPDIFSNMTYFDVNDLPMESQDGLGFPPTTARKTTRTGSNSSLQGNVDLNSPEAVWSAGQEDVGVAWGDDVFAASSSTAATDQTCGAGGDTNDSGVVMAQWHSCAICLEEYPEHQLLTHRTCGGTLCHACMERAVKHYGHQAVNCPVCRKEIDPSQDYVVMQQSLAVRPAKRTLLLPVLFRNDVTEDRETKAELFAYPNAIHTHNEISGERLYSEIESMLPVHAPFTIVVTDGQGIQCSRCVYSIHCRGCQLVREVDVMLHSDDHLTVVYQNLPAGVMESASRAYDDGSLGDLASTEPLHLRDCFRAFTQSEKLDEHNPWFCSKCCKPQCASKTIAVCRYPDTLIVYLKRFVFHHFTSTKLENKVLFPTEGLDMMDFLCPGISSEELNLVYDLQSCVCHFGGVNAGHYTCYVRNPLCNQWQYCNDETIVQQEPSESDSSNVYILFYQRRGLQVEFTPPSPLVVEATTSDSPPPLRSPTPPPSTVDQSCDTQSPLLSQTGINRLLSELNQNGQERDGASVEDRSGSVKPCEDK